MILEKREKKKVYTGKMIAIEKEEKSIVDREKVLLLIFRMFHSKNYNSSIVSIKRVH